MGDLVKFEKKRPVKTEDDEYFDKVEKKNRDKKRKRERQRKKDNTTVLKDYNINKGYKQ